jgi:hypothetical protein
MLCFCPFFCSRGKGRDEAGWKYFGAAWAASCVSDLLSLPRIKIDAIPPINIRNTSSTTQLVINTNNRGEDRLNTA